MNDKKIVIIYYDIKMLEKHFADKEFIGEIVQRMYREAVLEKANEIRIVIK